MKKIFLFAFLLCSFSAFAQYPTQPTTKQELGRQTTGDGLIYRGSGAPAYTPSNNRNAWIYYDTLNNRLYKSRLGSWSLMIQDTSAFNEIQMPYIVDDTLYLTQNVTGEPLTAYINRVWPIAALSDTASITGENQGDVAFVTGGTAVAFRGSAYWNPFSGGGGGGSFNSFNIAGDTGSDIVTDGQTVTVAGGYGINTAETGGTVTVTADTSQLATQSDISGFGTMSSFTVTGGSGTPQTITNGNTLTMSEGYGINTLAGATDDVRTEVDTTQIATQNDISGLPSGTGTNQRIVVWTGTNSQGNSTQLQSAAGVTLDANLAYRITGGTTASRPTGAAGMMYYNTSNNWFDLHNGTAWFNPARSATTNGLFTAGSVLFGNSDGTIQQDNSGIFYDFTSDRLGLGTTGNISIGEFGAQFTVQGSLPIITSYRTSSGVGQGTGYQIIMNSATSVATTLAYFNGYMIDNTAGAVSGGLAFFTRNAGSLTTKMNILGSGEVGIGTANPDRRLHSELSDAVTNAVVFPLRLTHITSGTAAAGSGAGMEFEAESAGGTNRVAGTIENPYTTATNAAEVSDLVFRTMRAGTLTESLRSLGNGTLQIGTLSGTATQMVGATAGNILCPITPGYGLSLSGGGARVDTTALKAQFLPLTLTGTTEVNTAGQVLRIRDAGAYPDVYMNSNYWTAASDVNTFIDVGSTSGQMQLNSAGRTIIAAATNVELQAGVTGEARIDSDSLVLEGVYPVGTSTDSVLVRDGSTGRVNLRAQSSFGSGTYLPLTLSGATVVNTAGNQLTFYDAGDNYPYLAIASTALTFGSAAGTSIASTGADINIESGATGGDINMYSANTLAIETETNISAISNSGNVSISTGGDGNITLDAYAGANGDVNIKAADVVRIQGDSEILITGDVKASSYVSMAYLVGSETAPTLSISNAGTGATVTGYSSENSAISGRFTFTTGTGAMAGGNVILVDMPTAGAYFLQVPIVQIQGDATKNTAGGLAAAVLIGSGKAVPIATTSDFTLYIDATGLANNAV